MPQIETAKPARVLIVDDHPAVREALALRISRHADLLVCGEASELAEALQLISETKPKSLADLAALTGRQPGNISRTLKTMASYGLVDLRRENTHLRPTVKSTEFRIVASA